MPKQWTRENIIRHLVEREAQGLPLTVGGQGVDRSIYEMARRTFGSWRNAIQAAGIAPQQVLTWERWTPARILVMVRHLAKRRRPLTAQQMERRYHNLWSAARRHFGSWSKAVVAAGVDPTRLQRVVPWTPERVIEGILTRALRNEPLVARLVEPRTLVAAGQRLFGGWAAAVAAAGLDTSLTVSRAKRGRPPRTAAKTRRARAGPATTPRPPWTKERVIAAMQVRWRAQKPMNSSAIARDDQALYGAMGRHLASWEEAMRAAGLDPDVYRRGPVSTPSARAAAPCAAVSRQSHGSEALRPDCPA